MARRYNQAYDIGKRLGRQLRREPGAAQDACLVGMRRLNSWLGQMAADAAEQVCGTWDTACSTSVARGYRDAAFKVARQIKRTSWCRRQR